MDELSERIPHILCAAIEQKAAKLGISVSEYIVSVLVLETRTNYDNLTSSDVDPSDLASISSEPNASLPFDTL